MTNVGDFFKAFKEAGAEEVDPSESGESSSRGPAFSGGGFRLGSDETPSAMIGGPSTSASKEDKPRRFVLKMWRDGFSIDDGDIRLYNDPQHRHVRAFCDLFMNVTSLINIQGVPAECHEGSDPPRAGEGGQGRRGSC